MQGIKNLRLLGRRRCITSVWFPPVEIKLTSGTETGVGCLRRGVFRGRDDKTNETEKKAADRDRDLARSARVPQQPRAFFIRGGSVRADFYLPAKNNGEKTLRTRENLASLT